MPEPKHYALTALHVIDSDLDFLRKAIEAKDPIEQIIFRIKDMKGTARAAFNRAAIGKGEYR
jgi:hypothetical protein